jgi:hypothetical protein
MQGRTSSEEPRCRLVKSQKLRLLRTARGGQPVGELPRTCRPQSDIEAHEIQNAVTRQLGEDIDGWKLSAASPITAALRLIETEAVIAFRLDCDLPAGASAYDRADVIAGAFSSGHRSGRFALRRFWPARP